VFIHGGNHTAEAGAPLEIVGPWQLPPSISGFDFLRRLHQYRASSLLEISTQFRAPFTDEVVSMTAILVSHRQA